MYLRLIISLFVLLFAALTGCSDRHQARHARPHHPTKQVAVHHLHDGRAVYRDDNGNFWFYMYLMNSNASNVAYSSGGRSYNYYSSPSFSSLPRGGAWVSTKEIASQTNSQTVANLKDQSEAKAAAEQLTEQQLEMELNDPHAEVVETPVETDASGGIITENELQTETQMELNLNDNVNDQSTESVAESSASESSSDSSSSSDSASSSDSSSSSDSGSSGGDSGGGGSSE
jgi:uncharacterized membrane protein YgcG